MDIACLNRKLLNQDEHIRNKIQTSLQLIDATINTVRKIASELRPAILDDLGLSEAVDWHSREFSKRTSIAVTFTSNVPHTKFAYDISTTIFRIFQEALTNVARHANATAVHCTLRLETDNLLLTVSDNGKGFDLQQQKQRKTLGLLGMKERIAIFGGTYDVSSRPDQGTTLSVHIPIT
jgi:signal transduction histidine kinase